MPLVSVIMPAYILRNFYKVTQYGGVKHRPPRSGDKNSEFISLFLGEIQYNSEDTQSALRQTMGGI